MMRIIINNGNACYFAFILETTICSCETAKSFDNDIIRNLKKPSQSNCCQGIGNIVAARNFQIETAGLSAILQNGKGCMSIFVISDICGLILSFMLQTICNDFT